MLPGSAAAFALLLALVPGFVFLRLTRSVRRPSDQTGLQELFEIIAVGILTTGVAVGVAVWAYPTEFTGAIRSFPTSESGIRETVRGGLLVVVAAVSLAVVAGSVVRLSSADKKYVPTVWESVFGETRADHERHVMFELADGRVFDGPIRAYTVTTSDGTRQLAIWGSIRLTKPRPQPTGWRKVPTPVKSATMNYDFVVVESTAITFAAMKFVPSPPKD